MQEGESRALREEILRDVGDLLRQDLAADAWGRILVEVVAGPDGAPVVSGIDVEEVLRDDSRVDAAFGGEKARAVVPVLAKAVEALCALDGLELDDVRGGTFLRRPDGGRDEFAWLPALVHAPSHALDRERDALMRSLHAKGALLQERYGFPAGGRVEVDLPGEKLTFRAGDGAVLHARATLLGTFAPPSRTWGWGGSHPSAPEAVRRASASLVDEIHDRDLWELSTPVFATDEATAWALAAYVCDRARGAGVFCSREGGGLVFMLLREVNAA